MGTMERRETPAYRALLGLSILFALAALATLLPYPAAAKPNVLGYRSLCPFAPAATAVCCLLAGACCVLRSRLASRRADANRYRPLFVPAGVGLLLLAVAVGFGFGWAGREAHFGALVAAAPSAAPPEPPLPADGVYRGSAARDEVSAGVEVAVAGGRIASVRLLSGANVDAALAERLGRAAVERQSLAVDAVAGATVSSQVFLEAAAAALGRP